MSVKSEKKMTAPVATSADESDPEIVELPPAAPVKTAPAAVKRDVTGRPTNCVVSDGTPHMGSAVSGGVVCSAHAMNYRSDGSRR